MTDRMMTCDACGYVGFDVAPKVVEVASTRKVRIQGTTEVYEVPERYRVEPRCADKYACQERQERASA